MSEPPPRRGRCAGLAYQLYGDLDSGPPLLLLTGLMGDGRRLRRLCRDLGPRPLLLVDPIGGGASDVPEDPEAYGWDAQVERLLALLDDHGLPAVDALGLSLGGMWAQQLYLRAPDRLRRVVLAASCLRAEPRLRALLHNLMAQVEGALPPLALARYLNVLLFSPPFLDRPGSVPLLEAMLTDEPLSAPGLLGQLGAILTHDARGRLAGLDGRVIGGELDWLMPPGDQERLARELGKEPPRLLSRAGHCLWIEQPETFAAAVREALADS